MDRELVFSIIRCLDEGGYKEIMHKLEEESGVFFNMSYFEDLVTNGEWSEIEKYLLGFTKFDDNYYSLQMFYEIRKTKLLEIIDEGDVARGAEILKNELRPILEFRGDFCKEFTKMLIRENQQQSTCNDAKTARSLLLGNLKNLIDLNPLFRNKLQFPTIDCSRLKTMINQRENKQLSTYNGAKTAHSLLLGNLKNLIDLNLFFRNKLQFPTIDCSRLKTMINQRLFWQPRECKNPKPKPDLKSLLVDHSCGQGNTAQPPSRVAWPSLEGRMLGPSSVPHQAVSVKPMGLNTHNDADFVHEFRKAIHFAVRKEVNKYLPAKPISVYPGQTHSKHSADDLPKNVVAYLNQGSPVNSMDFHPLQQTLLLVGTNGGEISIWEVNNGTRMTKRNFRVWDLGACSMMLQASLAHENTSSVNRIKWSPNGNHFGVAYSKHIIHLYAYYGDDDLRNHLEIDAHIGSVNDLAFTHLDKQLSVITCGEDKTIKIWDATTGSRHFTFEGHEAPVYSICPHPWDNIQFIFSIATDGNIKAWKYDNMGSRMSYAAPGHSCTTMAYSADGTRLFSCGTSKDGESCIVELNDGEGDVKRTYAGLGKCLVGAAQFDTSKNHYLAAGNDFKIKFWDMDNVNVLMSTDADGGLPASPCIRFSKDGALLGVSTSDNGIKILANAEGIKLMRHLEKRAGATSEAPVIGASGSAAGSSIVADRSSPMGVMRGNNGDSRIVPDVKSRISNHKMWKLTVINKPSQLRSLMLPDRLLAVRIVRLIYTNSGSSILALAYNGIHKLWKWQPTESNPSGKATTTAPPQLWEPCSEILMTNEFSATNFEKAVPCLALSKNESYVLSASGGQISLFNLITFKTMLRFMRPPPAATCLAFHPQDNNVVAIGMEDSSIMIYDVRADKVKTKLKGHEKRVTGLAFSCVLNVLVSSAADAEVCVWGVDGWEKRSSRLLLACCHGQTHVQFHKDQIHVLVVHPKQLTIYDAIRLDCIEQWVAPCPAITDATYSCDGQSILCCFEDGNVFVFSAAGLELRCRINAAAYLPCSPPRVHPLVITSHPSEANQFALGMSDGGVHVVELEPLQSQPNWPAASNSNFNN